MDDEAFLTFIDNTTKEKLDTERKLFKLDELEDMLAKRHYPNDWKKYFTRDEFLDNQYNPDYIKAIAKAFDKRIAPAVAKAVAQAAVKSGVAKNKI